MGNSSGWVARAVERWQLGLIYNLSSGAPTSITATSMLYANGVPDFVYPVDFNKSRASAGDIRNSPTLLPEGRYFDNNDMFVKVDDPQCLHGHHAQQPQRAGAAHWSSRPALLARCAGYGVPPGTPGAFDRCLRRRSTRPSVIVLQHPQPGKRGNAG